MPRRTSSGAAPRAPTATRAEAAQSALDALGNPTRRAIVQILARGPRSVGAIAAELPVTRPAVSKHLTILRRAELVVSSQRGTQNLFRLHPGGFVAARRWLDDFWDDALARFAALAEEEP